MDVLGAISIGMSPYLFKSTGFVVAWHGFFTFVAVAVAVFLAARWGSKEGLNADAIYSVSLWAIIGGIVGARVVHVIDFWEIYGSNFTRAFYIWEGGVAIYGAILGGFFGGGLYIIIRNSDGFPGLLGGIAQGHPHLSRASQGAVARGRAHGRYRRSGAVDCHGHRANRGHH